MGAQKYSLGKAPSYAVAPFAPANNDRRAGLALLLATAAAILMSTALRAETPGVTALPEAPAPQSSSAPQAAPTNSDNPAPVSDNQSHRILGILPNFRSVNTDQKLPPQSVKDKFVTASEDSFDYSALFVPVALAGYNYGLSKYPEFGTGGVAYGRYLWHAAVDQTSENYFVEFIVPAIAHEDTRFYTLRRGTFLKRTGYALSRVVVTRSDSGQSRFNFGEVVGAGAAAGVSNLYYPTRERSASNTLDNWGVNIGIDAAAFVVKEFYPDIAHRLLHQGPRPGAASAATSN